MAALITKQLSGYCLSIWGDRNCTDATRANLFEIFYRKIGLRANSFAPAERETLLDVHAPHAAIHTWKDFFVHLITITIGLLIALSLEGAVEWSHHRHMVHEALEKTYFEIRNNRKLLAMDLAEVREDLARTQTDLKTLVALRNGEKIDRKMLEYHIDWSSFADSAWRTAEATGAVNYMDYQTAQDLADVYAQQRIVSSSGLKVFEDQSIAIAPIFITGDPMMMSKEEIQLTLQRSAELLLNLRSLEQLLAQLDAQFLDELKKNDKE